MSILIIGGSTLFLAGMLWLYGELKYADAVSDLLLDLQDGFIEIRTDTTGVVYIKENEVSEHGEEKGQR